MLWWLLRRAWAPVREAPGPWLAAIALALLTLDGPRIATPAGHDRDYLGAIELLKPVLADAAFAVPTDELTTALRDRIGTGRSAFLLRGLQDEITPVFGIDYSF